MEQRTEEWYQARLGKVTASRLYDVCAKLKSGNPTAKYYDYMYELLAEIVTGQKAPQFVNAAMEWGIQQEEFARIAYQEVTSTLVQETGFHDHPLLAQSGGSPDGLINHNGIIEIKCPSTRKHLETIISGEIEEAYIYQMQWNMVCTNRLYCDFVSFDPRVTGKQIWIKRVERDDKLITKAGLDVIQFLDELEDLRRKFDQARDFNDF